MHGRTARAVSPALSHASRPRQPGAPAVLASPSQRPPGHGLLRPEKLAAVRLTSPHSLPTLGVVPRGTGGFPKGNLTPPVGGAPTPPASLAGQVLGPPLPVHAAQAATVRRPEPRFPPALPNLPRPPPGQARGDAKGTGAFRLLTALLRAEAGPRARLAEAPCSRARGTPSRRCLPVGKPATACPVLSPERQQAPVSRHMARRQLSGAVRSRCQPQAGLLRRDSWAWAPAARLGFVWMLVSSRHLPTCETQVRSLLRSRFSPASCLRASFPEPPPRGAARGAGAALRGKAPLGAPAQAPAGGGRAAGPPPQPALPALPALPPPPSPERMRGAGQCGRQGAGVRGAPWRPGSVQTIWAKMVGCSRAGLKSDDS